MESIEEKLERAHSIVDGMNIRNMEYIGIIQKKSRIYTGRDG